MRAGRISKDLPIASFESVTGKELEFTLNRKISSLWREAGATEVSLCVNMHV